MAKGYSEGSEAFNQCVEQLEQQRAQQELRKVRQDLDEYERLKRDRIEQHLINPSF